MENEKTLRRPSDDIAALDWNSQGNRKGGGPKITWKRTIGEEASSLGKAYNEVSPGAEPCSLETISCPLCFLNGTR